MSVLDGPISALEKDIEQKGAQLHRMYAEYVTKHQQRSWMAWRIDQKKQHREQKFEEETINNMPLATLVISVGVIVIMLLLVQMSAVPCYFCLIASIVMGALTLSVYVVVHNEKQQAVRSATPGEPPDANISPEYYALKQEYDHDVRRLVPLKSAHSYERAGRFEEAARICETCGLLDEAGSLRQKGRTTRVININADLNELLDQMRDGGLASVYKCPSCGAKLEISGKTKADELTTCQYCDTALDTTKIESFLKDALG